MIAHQMRGWHWHVLRTEKLGFILKENGIDTDLQTMRQHWRDWYDDGVQRQAVTESIGKIAE